MKRTEMCHRRWDKCFPMDTAFKAKRQLIVRVGRRWVMGDWVIGGEREDALLSPYHRERSEPSP
jgi:hypothetical protein